MIAWNRRAIFVVTGLLLAAFGLGIWMGTRLCRTPDLPPRVVYTPPAPSVPAAAVPAPSNPPACADIREAENLIGRSGCIAGEVLRVYTARGGNTFLDFCQDYRRCPFTSVIFASDKDKFGDLESLQGRRVEIHGDIVNYHGHAEIIVRDPHQVRSAP